MHETTRGINISGYYQLLGGNSAIYLLRDETLVRCMFSGRGNDVMQSGGGTQKVQVLFVTATRIGPRLYCTISRKVK